MKNGQPPSLAVLLATSFAFIIVQLDVTIVNVALPQIGQELHASVTDLQWVVDAYTLGFAVFLLSAGVIGDKYGSKRIFLSGFVLFALSSFACALAPTATALNIARALQGIGAAFLVPSSLSILNFTYAADKKMLAKAIGWWTAAGGVSIAAGPVFGGLLVSSSGWRGIFWVNIPICIAGFIITRKVVPSMPSKDPGRSFDVTGQILAIIMLTGFVGAVIEVHPLGLSHPLVQGGFLVAFLAGIAFLMVERTIAAPMLPLQLFSRSSFTGAVLFGVLVNFSYYGVIFILSFYLQKVRGFSVMATGLTFLPLTATFIFSNIASGWMMARMGLRIPMVLGGLIGATGYALLGLIGISQDATFLEMLPGLALIPAGMGLAVPAMTTSILSNVERHQAGTASAVLNMARQVGGALGVAIFGAMIATGSALDIIAHVRGAMGASTILLLVAAGLAFWCKIERTQEQLSVLKS
ncbi:MFS transporter [Glaciimonas immobilis]|uniref:DHA2 family methylenomycin A resistance protein-like MFS transporter n=1 Tax=Glaciimonas immobilis TaxID=728004 RepID=A0A840RX49_9BURK|nr:MFS transporter [Glaciimonas immobilis]KAF3996328.1 MFS transporter [Glaciimonas immobilis]MBB5202163.1 DHA2 family methylenomycin A resistance protein-like MFS transporter [Glaciimonas immobilis]